MHTAIDRFRDLRGRIAHRIQITTDSHAAYLDAMPMVFGGDMDFAMLVKLSRTPIMSSTRAAGQTL